MATLIPGSQASHSAGWLVWLDVCGWSHTDTQTHTTHTRSGLSSRRHPKCVGPYDSRSPLQWLALTPPCTQHGDSLTQEKSSMRRRDRPWWWGTCRAWPDKCSDQQSVYSWPAPFIFLSLFFSIFVPPQTTSIPPFPCLWSFCYKSCNRSCAIPKCSSPVSQESPTPVGSNPHNSQWWLPWDSPVRGSFLWVPYWGSRTCHCATALLCAHGEERWSHNLTFCWS